MLNNVEGTNRIRLAKQGGIVVPKTKVFKSKNFWLLFSFFFYNIAKIIKLHFNKIFIT